MMDDEATKPQPAPAQGQAVVLANADAPILYFEMAPMFAAGSICGVTLTAGRLVGAQSRAEGQGVTVQADVIATAHLRGNLAAFLLLRDTINKMEKAVQDDATRRAQTGADTFAGPTSTMQ